MRRKRASSTRKNSATGPPRKKTKKVSETECSGIDPRPSDGKTLPNDACVDRGSPDCIPVNLADDGGILLITVDDSDCSVTSEPNVPFTEHEKDNCEKCGTPSKYSPIGSSRENRKSSTESEVSGPCFEMLFSEERVKTEPLDNSFNSVDVSTLGYHHFNQITGVPTEFSVDVEKHISADAKSDCEECSISTLHKNNICKKSSAVGLPVLDNSGKTRISNSVSQNASAPIVSITPHIKVERIESLDMKLLRTATKPIADTYDYMFTDVGPCEIDENVRNVMTKLFPGNQESTYSCNLAMQGRNSCKSQCTCNEMDCINIESSHGELVLKCAKVKLEPSKDKENGFTVSDNTSTCTTAAGENVLEYERLCNITYKRNNVPDASLCNVTDSRGLSKDLFKRTSLETGCDKSADIAFGNQKSVVCTEDSSFAAFGNQKSVVCTEDSSFARCSPFNLSTLSLNPTEQKAAEVVGSLPLEKLQVLIKEYVERRCLNLEPIISCKELSKPCSQNDSACLIESKHIGTVLPHINPGVEGNFCQNSKDEILDTSDRLFSAMWKRVNELTHGGLIKTETHETVGLDLTCHKSDSTAAENPEQNSNVSSLHRSKYNENEKSDENLILSADTKCIPSVSIEDNCGILPSTVDGMMQNFASDVSDGAVRTSLCHTAKESSLDLVSENRTLLMKNSSSLDACTDKYSSKVDEKRESSTLCGASHGVEADLASSTDSGFTQTFHSQQNLKEEKCQNVDNEMESGRSCGGNCSNLVTQNQALLVKDISGIENSKEKHQSSSNLILKHNSEAAEISNAKTNVPSNEIVVANKWSDFYSAVTEPCTNEIQVKKELEDRSLNDIKSAFASEGEMSSDSININKLLSLETLKAIVDAVSSSSGNSFIPGSDASETNSKQKSSSTKLDETAFTLSLKRETEGSDNLLLTADILHAIAHTCETTVGSEHYDLPHVEKPELIPKLLGLCKKEQEVTDSLSPPALGSPVSTVKCGEKCGEQPSNGTSVSESDKQNLSNIESSVRVLQNVPSNAVSVDCGMEESTTTCVTHSSNICRNRSLESDSAENSSFPFGKEENTNSCRTLFNVFSKENTGGNNGSYQSINFRGEPLYDESNFSGKSVGGDDTKMRKRCKPLSSEANKKGKLAVTEKAQSVQQDNNVCVDDHWNAFAEFSGEKSENSITEGFSALLCEEKENSDSEVGKKPENMMSKSAASLDKNSHVPGNEEVCFRNFSEGEAYGQSEAIENVEIMEPGTEISNSKLKLQENSTCVTDSSFYAVPLSTKGSSKVQRFASRASFLTNEMLDGESKIIFRQQKALKEKKNEQTSDFLNSDECHLLVKTPELNINTGDRDFGVCEKNSTTSAFDANSRKIIEAVVNEELNKPSASNSESSRQKNETVINREQSKQSAFSRDPRRKMEVLVSSEYNKWSTSNRDDSDSLINKTGINSNTNVKLNEECKKNSFAESQKYVQLPPPTENYDQYYQNMYDTNNYWNYPNYMHRNRYPSIERFRTQRYPSFSPFQASTSSLFPCYSNTSLPYRPSSRFLPPHTRFGLPLQGYQGMPYRPQFSGAGQPRAATLTAGYPSRHSFPNMHSSHLPSYYPSQADFSPVQPESVPAHSTASPVFHSAVSTDFLPSATSPSKTPPTVTPASAALHKSRAHPIVTEPVQSEYVSSTESKSSCGISHSKIPKAPRREHFSEEPASPLRSSPFELRSFAPEIKSSKKSSSSVSHSCTSKNLKSSIVTYDKNKSKLSSKDFLNSVLTWSVNWLTQQLEISSPPPITDRIKKTESAYECYSDYYSTYFQFLLLETWEIIFQSWKREKYFHNYCCLLKQYKDYDKRMYEIHFETFVSNADFSSGKYPAEGYLVIIKFGLKGSGSTKIYGYISNHLFRPFCSSVDANHPCFKELPNKPVEGDLILSLVVKTSWKCENINPKTLPYLQILHFLKPAVKQFDALVKLQHSPLCGALLSPERTNCKLISLSKVQSVKTDETNDRDAKTISEIGLAILQPNPQLVIVDAVPGTNKVNTFVKVINVIKSFETATVKVKLLFCSQSNEVLDHVGCSLAYSQSDLGVKSKLRCVRLGKLTDIHPDMRNLSLHSLVESYVEALKDHELEECENDINDVINKITDTHDKITTLKKVSVTLAAKLEETIPDLKKKLKEKLSKRETVKIKHETLHEQHKNEAQWSILFGADVTLTTINDYHQLEVLDASHKNTFIPFSCCILDGANLCSELETLPPLLSEIEKLVLCGDPDVAPVILSKLIEKNDSYLSCFRRVRSLINSNYSDRRKKKKCT